MVTPLVCAFAPCVERLVLHLFEDCTLHHDTVTANIVPKLDMVYKLNVSLGQRVNLLLLVQWTLSLPSIVPASVTIAEITSFWILF
jgi:hypothetical protein